MQRLITLTQKFFGRRLRSIALAGLVGFMGWLMIASQPAYAAKSAEASTPVDQVMTQEPRDQAYEEALEVIDDPNGVQKTYKENLKQYRQANPNQEGIIDEAKDLVDKITPGKR